MISTYNWGISYVTIRMNSWFGDQANRVGCCDSKLLIFRRSPNVLLVAFCHIPFIGPWSKVWIVYFFQLFHYKCDVFYIQKHVELQGTELHDDDIFVNNKDVRWIDTDNDEEWKDKYIV